MNIKCPVCNEILIKSEKTFHCKNNHSFDIAKQGYVNLIPSNKKRLGDNKGLVDARTAFLSKGYYQNLQIRLKELCNQFNPSSLLDLGCGQGYYTNSIQELLPNCDIIGIDLSKEAIKTAAKGNKKVQYLIANSFDLPIMDSSMDCCTNIFTPIAVEEIKRVLKPGGKFILVSPDIYHLFELKEAVYENPYLNEPLQFNDSSFQLVHKESLNNTIHLQTNEDILALFSMTPYSYKTSYQDKEKLNSLNELTVRTEFILQVFEKI